MNDDLVKRLLKAAAAAPRPEPEPPAFALETRVLAAWRMARSAGRRDPLLRFFRIGLGFASALAVVIIALSLHAIAQEPTRELALPNVAVNLALSQ